MQQEVSVGMKFTRLTVTSQVGNYKRWNCVCDCGNTSENIQQSHLLSGNTRSCGCLLTEARLTNAKTHGMRKHRAYKSWLHMRQRCTNPENQDYPNYGGRGLTVHDDFNSFPAWLAEIGERPEGDRWSIGRLDNNIGYTYGNMRWETDAQQARNHSKSVVNTSGIVGVRRNTKVIAGNEYHSWIASWAHALNKKKTKEFSCNKYGEEVAKQMAIDYRNKMIDKLNAEGFEYADTHGSEKQGGV